MKAEPAELSSLKDLKPLLATPGPCLSLYLPLSTAPNQQGSKLNSLEWKELIASAAAKAGGESEKVRELLKPLRNGEEVTDGAPEWAKSVAILRAEDMLKVAYLHEQVQARAEVGPSFYVRPLLPELTKPSVFYVLALSQKNVRLLRCTLDSSEEVPLGANASTNYDEYMNATKPDHVSIKRGTAGMASGSSKGIVGTTTSELERKDEYLRHFFKQIDAGVGEALRGKTDPLVPVGVEYELPIYASVNTYPHIVDEGVRGAPNGLKSGEMHARAIEAIANEHNRWLDAALAEYDHKAGGGASNKLKDIVTAAHDGRVVTLIVSDSLESPGVFDEETNQAVGAREGGQDLINDAVVQTIAHAGNVLVATTKKMPNGAPAAAIFRY
ncbi:MAG: hypothetical protein ACJ746_24155 [Bryobacteraceae bacterium]